MTDEKICPFMSRPIITGCISNDGITENNWMLFETVCIRERCMMWEECRLIP